MIDISDKKESIRIATAQGIITLSPVSIEKIVSNTNEKGDVLENAKLAAIQAAKQVPNLVFMAHPIRIHSIKTFFEVKENTIISTVSIKTIDKTGVEIEAIAGVMNSLLAIFDLSKRYEKDDNGEYPIAKISDIKVLSKFKEEI